MNTRAKFIGMITLPILFILFISACDRPDELAVAKQKVLDHYDPEINNFIMRKMTENKIVMIGDSWHGQYLYYKTITDFLNHWVDSFGEGNTSNIPNKICLVLETDSSYNSARYKYFDSGSYSDLLCIKLFSGVSMTMGDFLFLDDLRDILTKIEEYNQTTFSQELHLDIIGPEGNWDTKNWSEEECTEMFIYQRDWNSKNNIVKYIDEHPEYKLLIYYGSAHLTAKKTLKRTATGSGESYFLGHYLKEEYKHNGGFYRICQGNPLTINYDICRALKVPKVSYIVENKHLDKYVEFNRLVESDGDASVIRLVRPYRIISVQKALSETHTKFLIENLDSLINQGSDFQKRCWRNVISYLYIVSGTKVDEPFDYRVENSLDDQISKWKMWYKNTKQDIVADIESLAIWERLIANFTNSSGNGIETAEYLLIRALGDNPLKYSMLSISEKGEAYSKYIKENKQRLLLDNLIPLLKIGTDTERTKALAVLQKETGQNFTEYRDWVNWKYDTFN